MATKNNPWKSGYRYLAVLVIYVVLATALCHTCWANHVVVNT